MPYLLLVLFYLVCFPLFALPKGFVYLHEVAPTIVQDIRYVQSNNFVGRPIRGYTNGLCILTKQAAEQLRQIEKNLQVKGYGLKVYDCYRPKTAVMDFFQWSKEDKDTKMKAKFYPRVEKSQLFPKGYIALSSGHSRGSTVDLTLIKINEDKHRDSPLARCYDRSSNYLDDNSIDMGTRFDCMDKTAHVNYRNLSKTQRLNRQHLSKIMQQYGFKPYPMEWWHFTLVDEPFPSTYFDFSVQ